MRKASFHILRVGLAITFLWIGVLIFKNPESWGGYVAPWVIPLLPASLIQTMQATAVLDLIIGALLLTDTLTWLASFVGAVHLAIVLTVSGITDITVRDIGLLLGLVAIFVDSLPFWIRNKILFRKNHGEKL